MLAITEVLFYIIYIVIKCLSVRVGKKQKCTISVSRFLCHLAFGTEYDVHLMKVQIFDRDN
jgi:hypothetical protein